MKVSVGLSFVFCLLFSNVHLNPVDPSLASEFAIQMRDPDVFKEISPRPAFTIIGFIANIFKIYSAIAKPNNSNSNQTDTTELENLIKDGFLQVEQQLNQIQQSINDIINLITNEAIKNQYGDDEAIIRASLRAYNTYLNMTSPQAIEEAKREFVALGQTLYTKLVHLMEGMLGGLVFAGDIFGTVVETERCRPGRTQSRTDQFMGLINTGIYAHAAFSNVSEMSEELSDYKMLELSQLYDQVMFRVNEQIVVCSLENEADSIMSQVMRDNSGQSSQRVADLLAESLNDRYDTKRWVVMVFKGLTGVDTHFVLNWFHSVYHVGGRNAYALSYDLNDFCKFDEAVVEALNNFPCDNYGHAETAVYALRDHLQPVDPSVNQLAAVRRNNDLTSNFNDQIDRFWKDCNSLTIIAVPSSRKTCPAPEQPEQPVKSAA